VSLETEAPIIDPAKHIEGPVLVVAPHSDDETLGCGATMALLAEKLPVYVAYVSDGRLSPSPSFGKPVPDWHQLVVARETEAKVAMETLGIGAGSASDQRLHFLGFEDAKLREYERQVAGAIHSLLTLLKPKTLFLPFRYDQNPDHLAVHRATIAALDDFPAVRTYQYFVYFRYPLLAERDIRRAVNPVHCSRVDMEPVATIKRRALDCYTSQVTRYFSWQERPLLQPALLDEHCEGFEYFVTGPLSMPDRELFLRNSIQLQFNIRYGGQIVSLKKRIIG
jgi:LmbE family N-acetylglucosaminyl deacetylase